MKRRVNRTRVLRVAAVGVTGELQRIASAVSEPAATELQARDRRFPSSSASAALLRHCAARHNEQQHNTHQRFHNSLLRYFVASPASTMTFCTSPTPLRRRWSAASRYSLDSKHSTAFSKLGNSMTTWR